MFGLEKSSIEDFINVSIVENYPPHAHAGNDTNAIEGSIITLDASESFDLDNPNLSFEWKDIPLLARTHGQPASPTILGKEFHVYFERIYNQFKSCKNPSIV